MSQVNHSKNNVWITGAGGLIGNQLIRCAPSAGVRPSPGAETSKGRKVWENFTASAADHVCAPEDSRTPKIQPIPLLRPDLDLTDFAAVEKRFKQDQPFIVIHCAAISRSPDCQGNPAGAHKINVAATEHLASLSSDRGFVFLSSDLVFDGRKGNYREDDPQNPLSIYGETKTEAEKIVLKNPAHAIARLTLCYGQSPKGHRSFNEEICDLWRAGKPARLFTDEYRCVIPAVIVARAIWEIALGKWAGVYHVGGAENLSRVQIGELLAARCPELNPKIHSCSLKEYEGAHRAADTSLDSSKLQKLLSFPLPGFSQWLKESFGS